MGKDMAMLKTAPVAAVPPAARQREAHEAEELLSAAAQSLHEMLREKRARRSHDKARKKSAASRAAPENLTLKQYCDLM